MKKLRLFVFQFVYKIFIISWNNNLVGLIMSTSPSFISVLKSLDSIWQGDYFGYHHLLQHFSGFELFAMAKTFVNSFLSPFREYSNWKNKHVCKEEITVFFFFIYQNTRPQPVNIKRKYTTKPIIILKVREKFGQVVKLI